MFKKFVTLFLCVSAALLMAPLFVFAADAVASTPAAVGVIDSITNFLSGSQGVLTTIIGFLFVVSKVSSNEKAGAIVRAVQTIFDGLAKMFQLIADILAQAIKSDGLFGKK